MLCEVSGLLDGDAECQSSLATLDLDLSAACLAKDVSVEAFGGGCGPLALGVELGALLLVITRIVHTRIIFLLGNLASKPGIRLLWSHQSKPAAFMFVW